MNEYNETEMRKCIRRAIDKINYPTKRKQFEMTRFIKIPIISQNTMDKVKKMLQDNDQPYPSGPVSMRDSGQVDRPVVAIAA